MMTVQVNKAVLYASEAAALLGYSTQYVYKLINTNQLYGYKDLGGKAWRIPVKSVADYIESHSSK